MLGLVGCNKTNDHTHEPGAHGGFIVSVGRDHYHAEALFADGQLRLYLLDQDQAKVIDIESQQIEVFIRPFGDAQARPMTLSPSPQEGDREGMASLFIGDLPADLGPKQLLIVVPSLRIQGERYRFSFATAEPHMPPKVTNEAEQELYLTPGGLYTDADIQANDSLTASAKFAGFQSAHDMHPVAGSKICPITQTAANPECTWIIDGQEYQFCCPPCVDEFLKKAKTDPESVQSAASYVK